MLLNNIIIFIFIIFFMLTNSVIAEDISSKELDEIFSKISHGKYKKNSSNTASFYTNETPITILGASQKNLFSYKDKISTPINNDIEISILSNPISDTHILPFTHPIQNEISFKKIELTAASDEYEPFSFIIRAGNKDIDNINISSSNLTFINNTISNSNIDIKIVKNWYQSSGSIHRGVDSGKRLTSELLLNNDSLVTTNHEYQVNLIQHYENIIDSHNLMPFNIDSNTNKQIWGTLYIDRDTPSGTYLGKISLTYSIENETFKKDIDISVNVLPFNLEKPAINYSLYYLAWQSKDNSPHTSARTKSLTQIKYELEDMKKHGLTNVVIDYGREKLSDNTPNFEYLHNVATLVKEIMNNDDLLFVDWSMEYYNDYEQYRLKIERAEHSLKGLHFNNIFIYNFDEAPLNKLLSYKYTMIIPHELGLKNFSATSPQYIPLLDNYLDIFILHRDSLLSKQAAKLSNNTIWAYNDPQAGEEKALTYRKQYGISLWLDYFDGACNYAYQSGEPGWNDWADPKWRPHNMTYPTMGKPISTLQWEGWREAVDDSRYLNVLLKSAEPIKSSTDRKSWLESTIGISINSPPNVIRQAMINTILKNTNQRQ